jgi:hypothetical protein
MEPNQRCTLTVTVTKTFASIGKQPIPNSWSQVATLTNGSQLRSNYTGQLAVNVVSCP